MASSSSSTFALSSSSTILDSKAPRQSATPSSPLPLPTLPPPPAPSQIRPWKTTAYCRKIARNVMAMASGEASAEVANAELPEFIKKAQEAWGKVEDKYAVSSLAVAGLVGLWASAGVVSAIDKLPLIPGLLELVGIGYTGWFVYNNVLFEPDREAFVKKLKETYSEIIGSS